MSQWQPIETAPKDGAHIIALMDGEIYHARWSIAHSKWAWRTHVNRILAIYEVLKVEHEGEMRRAQLPVNEPWEEHFEHGWCLWERGFDELTPTHWMLLPVPPTEAA